MGRGCLRLEARLQIEASVSRLAIIQATRHGEEMHSITHRAGHWDTRTRLILAAMPKSHHHVRCRLRRSQFESSCRTDPLGMDINIPTAIEDADDGLHQPRPPRANQTGLGTPWRQAEVDNSIRVNSTSATRMMGGKRASHVRGRANGRPPLHTPEPRLAPQSNGNLALQG